MGVLRGGDCALALGLAVLIGIVFIAIIIAAVGLNGALAS
jgi:hypothetical protein